jgi:hypothetical protein
MLSGPRHERDRKPQLLQSLKPTFRPAPEVLELPTRLRSSAGHDAEHEGIGLPKLDLVVHGTGLPVVYDLPVKRTSKGGRRAPSRV